MKINTFPKWQDLPELDLYLDQVLLYVNKLNKSLQWPQEKDLTAAMINNYVKHGHLDKPIKKKYNRSQLARLIALTQLKNVFAIQEISQILSLLEDQYDPAKLYDYFVSSILEEEDSTIPAVISSACQTLKRYHQTQELALDLKGKQE